MDRYNFQNRVTAKFEDLYQKIQERTKTTKDKYAESSNKLIQTFVNETGRASTSDSISRRIHILIFFLRCGMQHKGRGPFAYAAERRARPSDEENEEIAYSQHTGCIRSALSLTYYNFSLNMKLDISFLTEILLNSVSCNFSDFWRRALAVIKQNFSENEKYT